MDRSFMMRRLLLAGFGAALASRVAPAAAQQAMTAEKMQLLIDYALRRNAQDGNQPTHFSRIVGPVLFLRSDEILVHQIGNDEGALKERFSVTTNLGQPPLVVLFSRTEDAVYFHLTGVHLRRERSVTNRRQGGASEWTAPEAAADFTRQMTYWARQTVS